MANAISLKCHVWACSLFRVRSGAVGRPIAELPRETAKVPTTWTQGHYRVSRTSSLGEVQSQSGTVHSSCRAATIDHSHWVMSRRVPTSKARLGCAKMATACRDFVVRTVVYTRKPRLQSRLPWWPHLINLLFENCTRAVPLSPVSTVVAADSNFCIQLQYQVVGFFGGFCVCVCVWYY